MTTFTTYAAYDNSAIYGVGSTADAAIADAAQYGATDCKTAPMTKYMAAYVSKHGFNPELDGFGVVKGKVVSDRAYWRLSGAR